MSERRAVTVVLAAGAGLRLGGVAKALLRGGDGASFLSIIAARAAQGGAPVAVVVVGEPHREATEREARRLGLCVAVNADPGRGMASSVATGFSLARAREWDAQVALLWPVDHARVAPATVDAVVRASDARRIVVPTFDQRGGHPTAFGRSTWAALAACDQAADGARSVLRAHAELVVRVPVDDPGVLADVDTPADREALS